MTIETLDNPGWIVKIDLRGIEAEHRTPEEVKVNRSESDWIFYRVAEKQFRIACGPQNLSESIEIFWNGLGSRLKLCHRRMRKTQIAGMLGGSDRRSIGRANEATHLVLKQPKLFRELMAGLWHDDPIIRMRAADATEKMSAKRPEFLQRYKSQLLGLLADTNQIELRWHLAQMIPRLKLTARERQRAAGALRHYLDDRSSIVRTWALNALVELFRRDETLRPEAKRLVEEALHSGSAAMKARARKLLKIFQD